MHMPLKKIPCHDAGQKGFKPHSLCKTAVSVAMSVDDDDIKFPTLAELNAECSEFDEGEEDLLLSDDSLCRTVEVFVVTLSQANTNRRGSLLPLDPNRHQGSQRLGHSLLAF